MLPHENFVEKIQAQEFIHPFQIWEKKLSSLYVIVVFLKSFVYNPTAYDSMQIPSLVATKMTKMKPTSFFIASPEMYSKASMRCIGYEHLCTPYLSHSVQWFITNALPDVLLNAIMFKYFIGMRKRGHLKESRNKAI